MKHINQLACCHVQCLLLTPAGGRKRAKKGPEDHDLLQHFGQLQSCRQILARAYHGDVPLDGRRQAIATFAEGGNIADGSHDAGRQSSSQPVLVCTDLAARFAPYFTVRLQLLSATYDIRRFESFDE